MSELKVLGRMIGQYREADHFGENLWMHYGFKSSVQGIPNGECLVDFDNGLLIVETDDGEELYRSDIIDALKDIAHV